MYYTFKIDGKDVRLYHNDLVGDNGAMIEEFPAQINKETGIRESEPDKAYKLERDADGYLTFKYSNGEVIYVRDAECLTPEEYVELAYQKDVKGIDLEYMLCTVLQKYGLHSIAVKHRLVELWGDCSWITMHIVPERNRMPVDGYKLEFSGLDSHNTVRTRTFYVEDFVKSWIDNPDLVKIEADTYSEPNGLFGNKSDSELIAESRRKRLRSFNF